MVDEPDEYLPTRRTLLSRLRNREDQESWKDFFDTYWKLIYGVAIRAGLTREEAEDVVQETVLLVVRVMPNFKYDPSRCSFKSWLLHLTRKRISNELRRRPREVRIGDHRSETDPSTPILDRVPNPGGSDLDAIWQEEWEANLLHAALENIKRRVNPKQYQMFYLYVIKGLPVSEVASTLRVYAGQVYLAKHRISRLVKLELKRLEARQI